MHWGVDLVAAQGAAVYAAATGKVVECGWDKGGYGNVIVIQHDGFATRYAHLDNFVRGIEGGKRVNIGDHIGFCGSTGDSTGPHLHFEIRVGGPSGTAVEPRYYTSGL